MTLILSLANRDNIIQMSDRRLTANGVVVDEDSGKSGTLFCTNGRFAFGFTGIARADNLEIRRWILDTLLESGPPDYAAGNVFKRFKKNATDCFKKNQILRQLSPKDRRLTIMFTGYLYTHSPPMIGCAIISNCINQAENVKATNSWDEFVVSYTSEKKDRKENISFIQRVGAWPAMNESDVSSLKSLLEGKKSYKALIEKATSLMLQMSDRPGSRGTIGKQITWIRIPSGISESVESGYYSNIPTHTVFMPSSVTIISDKKKGYYEEPSVTAIDPISTPPMAVPKVHKNAPCPCGSGKKYKNCHGKKKK